MRVLITGASGVLGIPLVEELHARGCEILVLLSPGSPRNGRLLQVTGSSMKWIECDLADYDNLRISERFDAFVHMAWSGGMERENVEVNLASARHCAAAVRLASRLGCQVFVATGSQAECGPQQTPLSANTVCIPDTPFGAAKNLARDLARIEARKTPGMRFNWVRVVSVYGPFDREESMVISSLRKLLRKETPAFTSCDQIWDFLYATDAALALVAILFSGRDGQIYTLGSGQAHPLREYINPMLDRFGVPSELCLGKIESATSTPRHLVADITPLQAHFGWAPLETFGSGLKKTIQYCKAYPYP